MTSFTSLDANAINVIRALAADVVQKANSGHPGAPMGCAPMAHVLFTKFMKCDPAKPKWMNRDRFVLSNGHGCALHYILLHLLGYKSVDMEQLKSFRQLGSRTPGHPESHMTEGIEVTTGPLGQGISAAVGLAIAQENLAATFNKPGFELFNNYTYTIVGDGCLQEGVSAEACSLAGHLRLGRLIVLYDDNHITIDGNTNISFTEDVCKRFEAYGWHTLYVENGDDNSADSLEKLAKAIEQAKLVSNKPSLIRIRTTIGYGSSKAGTDKVHGAPLGKDDIIHAKTSFGFDPSQSFNVPNQVYEMYRSVALNGASESCKWMKLFEEYRNQYPELAKEFTRRESGKLPLNFEKSLPTYSSTDPQAATRKLSENVINAIGAFVLPEFIGGSADLTASNLTRWHGAVDFQHPETRLGSYQGRYIRFGVREHGMAAICNGIAAYGMLIPFCSTFLNFISYALGAVRISALSQAQVLYIMTHDSIGLGEDGPTHQPVETLAGLRATPNILVFRPADGNEVSGAYLAAMLDRHKPSVLALSRQNVRQLPGSSLESVLSGGYVIHETGNGEPSIIIVATGTEVDMAIQAADIITEKHDALVRVVSMPCTQIFDEQSEDYRRSIFPTGVPVLSVEALSVYGWERYAHASVGMSSFGASAPANKVYEHFGITIENVVSKSEVLMKTFPNRSAPIKMMNF